MKSVLNTVLSVAAMLALAGSACGQQEKAVAPAHPNPSAEKVLQEVGALIQSGKFSEAEAPAKEAAKLAPSSPVPHNLLGFIYEQLKQPSSAEPQYREAIRLDPQFAAARGNLGNLLLQQNKLAATRKELGSRTTRT